MSSTSCGYPPAVYIYIVTDSPLYTEKTLVRTWNVSMAVCCAIMEVPHHPVHVLIRLIEDLPFFIERPLNSAKSCLATPSNFSFHFTSKFSSSCYMSISMRCISMFILNVHPHAHVHVYAACLCCLSMLHVHAGSPCCMSLLHVHTACPCCISKLHVNAVCISLLSFHLHAICPYQCAAFPCSY